MMSEEMMKHMSQMMGNGMSMGMGSHPLAQGAMMAATGYAAGRGLLGFGLLRSPLVLFAGGIAAGYLLRKHEKEILAMLSKLTGMGKDFVLQQKENLDDLMAEAQEAEAAQAASAAAAPAKPKRARKPRAAKPAQ